jgi:hypothetical protein
MDFTQLSKEFWSQGYLVLHDFFEDGLMEEIDGTIRQHFGDDPEFWHEEEFLKKSRTEVIPWFPQNPDLPEFDQCTAAPFDRLEADEKLRKLTRAILGSHWSPLYSMVMFSKKGTSGQAWHQDCPPNDSSKFNLNRLVYCRDLTEDIGGQTVVMPGSHRRGELPVGDPHETLEGQVVLSPCRGTLVLLHGHTWHRVMPISGAYRYSTNYRACPKGTPTDITDICVYRNMRYSFSSNRVIEERRLPT